MRTFALLVSASAGLYLTVTLGFAAEAKPGVLAPNGNVAAACQKCHGVSGDSDSPQYPRLNGQQADYIAAQLRNFRDHKRDDTHARAYMWGMARAMDDKTIAELGKYFASQKPTASQTGGALAPEGEKLFLYGDSAKGVVACQQCHGKAGEGGGAIPRIAGQHAAYFRMALGAFRSSLRQHDMMTAVAKNLSDHQIEALSSYLAND